MLTHQKTWTTVEEIKKVLATVSPADRKQIIEFTRANTEPPRINKPFGVWKLTTYRHTGSGKEHIGASLALEGKGLSANEFRVTLGLPAILTKKAGKKPLKKGAKK